MRKTIMLTMAIVAIGFIAGCSSASKHANMTGIWKYTFEETGKSGDQNGSMTITQSGYSLKGKCIDAFGEFEVTGFLTENSPNFTINGKRNDGKRDFSLSGMLTTDDSFEGTYTTDQNTSGTMEGNRITAD